MKRILFTPGIAAVEALGSITRLIAIADELKKKQDNLDIVFRTAGRHFERFYNAEKASEIGCALNLKVDSFNKEELLDNCKKIMKNEDCKKALNKYSLKIKSYGGAARAAELLLNLI